MTVETPEAVEQPVNPEPQSTVDDYWGTDETHRWYFPDKVQFIEFRVMNEGDRVKFQKLTNQDLVVNRDNTAKVRVDPAAERHSLLKSSVIGWKMYKAGEELLFSKKMLEMWLDVAPPKLVDDLEFEIRKKNPWMQADMSVEEIDKEIERLESLRKQARERELGEVDSATK